MDLLAAPVSTSASLPAGHSVALVNTGLGRGKGHTPKAEDLGLEGMRFPRWLGVHPDTPQARVEEVSESFAKLAADPLVHRLIAKRGESVSFVPAAAAQARYEEMVEAGRGMLRLLND